MIRNFLFFCLLATALGGIKPGTETFNPDDQIYNRQDEIDKTHLQTNFTDKLLSVNNEEPEANPNSKKVSDHGHEGDVNSKEWDGHKKDMKSRESEHDKEIDENSKDTEPSKKELEENSKVSKPDSVVLRADSKAPEAKSNESEPMNKERDPNSNKTISNDDDTEANNTESRLNSKKQNPNNKDSVSPKSKEEEPKSKEIRHRVTNSIKSASSSKENLHTPREHPRRASNSNETVPRSNEILKQSPKKEKPVSKVGDESQESDEHTSKEKPVLKTGHRLDSFESKSQKSTEITKKPVYRGCSKAVSNNKEQQDSSDSEERISSTKDKTHLRTSSNEYQALRRDLLVKFLRQMAGERQISAVDKKNKYPSKFVPENDYLYSGGNGESTTDSYKDDISKLNYDFVYDRDRAKTEHPNDKQGFDGSQKMKLNDLLFRLFDALKNSSEEQAWKPQRLEEQKAKIYGDQQPKIMKLLKILPNQTHSTSKLEENKNKPNRELLSQMRGVFNRPKEQITSTVEGGTVKLNENMVKELFSFFQNSSEEDLSDEDGKGKNHNEHIFPFLAMMQNSPKEQKKLLTHLVSMIQSSSNETGQDAFPIQEEKVISDQDLQGLMNFTLFQNYSTELDQSTPPPPEAQKDTVAKEILDHTKNSSIETGQSVPPEEETVTDIKELIPQVIAILENSSIEQAQTSPETEQAKTDTEILAMKNQDTPPVDEAKVPVNKELLAQITDLFKKLLEEKASLPTEEKLSAHSELRDQLDAVLKILSKDQTMTSPADINELLAKIIAILKFQNVIKPLDNYPPQPTPGQEYETFKPPQVVPIPPTMPPRYYYDYGYGSNKIRSKLLKLIEDTKNCIEKKVQPLHAMNDFLKQHRIYKVGYLISSINRTIDNVIDYYKHILQNVNNWNILRILRAYEEVKAADQYLTKAIQTLQIISGYPRFMYTQPRFFLRSNQRAFKLTESARKRDNMVEPGLDHELAIEPIKALQETDETPILRMASRRTQSNGPGTDGAGSKGNLKRTLGHQKTDIKPYFERFLQDHRDNGLGEDLVERLLRSNPKKVYKKNNGRTVKTKNGLENAIGPGRQKSLGRLKSALRSVNNPSERQKGTLKQLLNFYNQNMPLIDPYDRLGNQNRALKDTYEWALGNMDSIDTNQVLGDQDFISDLRDTFRHLVNQFNSIDSYDLPDQRNTYRRTGKQKKYLGYPFSSKSRKENMGSKDTQAVSNKKQPVEPSFGPGLRRNKKPDIEDDYNLEIISLKDFLEDKNKPLEKNQKRLGKIDDWSLRSPRRPLKHNRGNNRLPRYQNHYHPRNTHYRPKSSVDSYKYDRTKTPNYHAQPPVYRPKDSNINTTTMCTYRGVHAQCKPTYKQPVSWSYYYTDDDYSL